MASQAKRARYSSDNEEGSEEGSEEISDEGSEEVSDEGSEVGSEEGSEEGSRNSNESSNGDPQPEAAMSSIEEELARLKALLAQKDSEIQRKNEELQKKDDIIRWRTEALEKKKAVPQRRFDCIAEVVSKWKPTCDDIRKKPGKTVPWPVLKADAFEFVVSGSVEDCGKCCKKHKACMALGVRCRLKKALPEHARNNWVAHVNVEFTLQFQLERKGRKDVKKTASVVFSPRQNCVHAVHMHFWDDVANKDYGFLRDKRLLINTVIKLVHVDWNATTNFFHRDAFLSDATLLVGTHRFHVNRMYLSQYSEFFKTMFSGKFGDAAKEDIPVEVEVPEDFEKFLRYLYPERRRVTEKDLDVFIPLADYFEVPKLMDECGELLQEAQSITLAERLHLANKYNLTLAQARICEQLKRKTEIRGVMDSRFYEQFPEDLKLFILQKLAKLDD